MSQVQSRPLQAQGDATPVDAAALVRRLRDGFATGRTRPLGWRLGQLDALARLLDEHEAGAFDHSGTIWLLLVFEGFLASEMDAAGQSAPALAHA